MSANNNRSARGSDKKSKNADYDAVSSLDKRGDLASYRSNNEYRA